MGRETSAFAQFEALYSRDQPMINSTQTAGMLSGLWGRILHGHDGDFEFLTPNPKRKVVFTLGPLGLVDMIRATDGFEMLQLIGYDEAYIRRKVGEGERFKLVVASVDSQSGVRATWDNMLNMVQQAYPELGPKIEVHRDALKNYTYEEICSLPGGFDIAEAQASCPTGPNCYDSPERLAVSEGSLVQVRAFLLHTLNLNSLYSGDGWTYQEDGTRTNPEYGALNRNLTLISNRLVIDLCVELPESGRNALNANSWDAWSQWSIESGGMRRARRAPDCGNTKPYMVEWRSEDRARNTSNASLEKVKVEDRAWNTSNAFLEKVNVSDGKVFMTLFMV